MTGAALAACPDYGAETVRGALVRAIGAAGGLDWVQPGMRIAVKANLCAAMRPEEAATTHPVLLAELTRLLRARGASVVIGDSPGGPFVAAMLNRIYAAAGLRLAEEAGAELNHDFSHESVEFPGAAAARTFEYTSWLARCDAVISFSKLKSHGLMGMTAAIKNLYGVVPGTVKSEYHFRFPDPGVFADMLVDLNEYVKPRLCLCDAVDIMEGNGPTKGTVRHMGALLAAPDPYSLDRLCASLLGIEVGEVPPLVAARQRGLWDESAPLSCGDDPAPFRLTDFRRSGATVSFFYETPDDNRAQRLLKRTMAALFRSRPILREGCTGCGTCQRLCPAGAITLRDRHAVIDRKKCIRCFCCQEFCPAGAMRVKRPAAARLLGGKRGDA